MFSNEEQFFLNTIAKMLSPNNEERKEAEQNIRKWVKETYLQVLQACNKFITCETIEPNLRKYACYILELLTKEDCYENWQKTNLELKKNVQNNSLGLLGDKDASIRHAACSLVSSLSVISIKDQGWPDLINILCNACNADNIEFKISAIKTLGLIWEELPKEPFSLEELSLMENTIIKLLSNPINDQLSLECLKAYEYFINYIKNKFCDKDYLQNTLKLFISYCSSINNLNTEIVAKEAIHRITQILIEAYDFIEPHFRNISEFFIMLCKGTSEYLAVQAYIFFTEIASDEIDRRKKRLTCRKYIQSIWDILWDSIQHTLNNRTNQKIEDGFSRYDSLKELLFNISIICDEKIIDDIFAYMGAKLNDPNPAIINSAIYAFGCILETVHEKKIESVIPDSIKSLNNLFSKNNEQLSLTLSWCFSQICETHSKLLIFNNGLLSNLINIFLSLLRQENLNNKIKSYICNSIFSLASFTYNHNLQALNTFSPYLKDLLLILESLAYLPQSYNTESNLSQKCFIAISSLLECSTRNDQQLITFFMEKIYTRLNEAQNISNFQNSKEMQNDFQSYLCLSVQSLCKNVEFNLINLDNKKIEDYFNIIDNFFKLRKVVFEEGLLALSSLISLISDGNSDSLLQRIMPYVLFCLDNYTDASNCETACLSLLDLIHSARERFIPYIKQIYPLFIKIIKADDAKKNIFTLIILVYSDLFGFAGNQIWQYKEEPLNYMTQLIDFSIRNHEKYLNNSKIEAEDFSYFIKLNEGLVDFISGVASFLNNADQSQREEFKIHLPEILEYLTTMMGNSMFNPSSNFLSSTFSFLIDLAQIYKKIVFKKLNDNTLQRLFQLANDSKHDELINLKDYLQNIIFTIKNQS